MSNKVKIIVGVVVLATVFAFGRWSAPVKIKTETKIVEVDKKVDDINKKEHKKTVIVHKPDGTIITTITDDTDTHKHETDTSSTVSDTTKEVVRRSSTLTVSALTGLSLNGYTPIYGAHVTKQIIGPLALGVWGLSSRELGVSVGLSF